MSTPFKNVIFRRNRMSFFAGQHTGVYSLNYRPTCRLEARQVLIYQCILDLTGENDKYNYSKAAHLYPLLSYSPCSAKNYKIASALTAPGAVLFELKTGKGGQPKLPALVAVEIGGATLPHLQQGRRLPVPSSISTVFHYIPCTALLYTILP